MRRPIIAFILIACFSLCACAEPLYKRVNSRQSFSEAKTIDHGYIKKAAIILEPGLNSAFGRQAEQLFFQNLVATIRANNSQLNLSTQQDAEFPSFFKGLEPAANVRQVFPVLDSARLAGFQCVLVAQLQNIVPEKKKTGGLWFRKTRYFITATVVLNVYDTITGTKIVDQSTEETVKVDVTKYEDFTEGRLFDIPEVNDMISELAERLGEEAAETVADHRWMTSVIAVDGNVVRLSADQSVGLKDGDRLSVFEGRRKVQGPEGEIYTIPGYKLANIQISGFVDNSAEAVVDGKAEIQPGDIAIPTSE